jgi:hypothetical protein
LTDLIFFDRITAAVASVPQVPFEMKDFYCSTLNNDSGSYEPHIYMWTVVLRAFLSEIYKDDPQKRREVIKLRLLTPDGKLLVHTIWKSHWTLEMCRLPVLAITGHA